MTKIELIKKVAKEANASKSATSAIIDAFIYVIETTVASGEEVNIRGFLKFAPKHIEEHAYRKNIFGKDGGSVVIPAHNAVRITQSKMFRSVVSDMSLANKMANKEADEVAE